MRNGTRAADRRRSALRLGVVPMLIALVGIPLLVVGGLIVQDLSEADDQRSTVQDIVPVANTRLEAIRLGAALSDERTWAIAALGVVEFDLASTEIHDLIGVDIDDRLRRARKTTDSFSATWPRVVAALETPRAGGADSLDVAAGYLEIMDEVAAVGDRAAQDLQELAVAVPDGEELLRALEISEAVADAQLAVNGQFVSALSARFVGANGDPAEEFQSLVEFRRIYTLANDRLERLLAPGPLADRYRATIEATAEQTLLQIIDAQIVDTLGSGLQPIGGGISPVAFADIPELRTLLVSAEASSAAWIDVSLAAGQHLIVTASERERASSEQINESRLLLTATGLVALLATILVALLFSRSISRLAVAAQALRDGRPEQFEPSGPREVYVAGAALSEATSNFDLLRKQATVLAEGDLSHPDLARTAPGELGANLKRVVDTLSESMHEQKRARDEVVWEASHDGLTGLLNRSAAMEHIGGMLANRGDPFAVLVVDLDGFKAINDSHGHPIGDEVLVEVAHRLQRHIRAADQVSRLGGDEFVMVIAGPDPEVVAHDIAVRTLAAAAETIELSSGAIVRIGACIGIAISDAASTVSSLLKHADLAVYEAKSRGRNGIVTCTSDLLAENRRAAQLTADILGAIDTDELRMEYQPIVDPSGRILAVEALVRWDHAVHGLIMPDNFIAIAERSDLIVAIDHWAVRTAIAQLASWTGEHPELRDLVVSVNLSTRHLSVDTAADDVLGPLREFGVDPQQLSVEINETALLANAQTRDTLSALRAVGIRIAVADFGTGHSSIAQLRHLPVDVVKINRVFTSQLTTADSFDAALVRLIIDTAHLLGAEIITEGVENKAQADAAIAMGTDALQGWYFHPSVPPAAVPDLLIGGPVSTARLR